MLLVRLSLKQFICHYLTYIHTYIHYIHDVGNSIMHTQYLIYF